MSYNYHRYDNNGVHEVSIAAADGLTMLIIRDNNKFALPPYIIFLVTKINMWWTRWHSA